MYRSMNDTNKKLGDVVVNDTAFTSANGIHYGAGECFVVCLIGEVNVQAYSERSGGIVWLESGRYFLTNAPRS
jgi:hypothetical protein